MPLTAKQIEKMQLEGMERVLRGLAPNGDLNRLTLLLAAKDAKGNLIGFHVFSNDPSLQIIEKPSEPA